MDIVFSINIFVDCFDKKKRGIYNLDIHIDSNFQRYQNGDGIIVGVCGGGFAGALIAGGAVICTFNSYVVKDIYDKVRWLSLLYTNGLRVANRALRCYGLL